jgi:hypothetical protein
MLLIIGDKRNGRIVMLNLGTQDVLIPFDHGVELMGSVDDVRKFVGALS